MYEAISYTSIEHLRELTERCLDEAPAQVLSGPETALVMVRARDTVDGEVFNFGEVLVTRCEASLDGELGWGMVVGDDPDRAVCAAVLDAASRRGFPDGIEDGLKRYLGVAREARHERWAEVQPTRVEFEEMRL